VKRFQVIIPPFVQEQIRAQVLYIANDSIDNALEWEDRLRAAINGIGSMRGHAIDEAASGRLSVKIRKLVFEGTYLIHYRVNELTETIEIVNFRHGARVPRRGEP
jgi:plasmid stabilization system protein ParE